ncbi:MAG: hypothetical protein OEZ68_05530 [Gammaproteobacteria bacterium]|nr:hypothetical protein [Gammaproteobacteria bacterium]MDH5800250.1 hypothetical protein [Gammaproteobacteria bacterium]
MMRVSACFFIAVFMVAAPASAADSANSPEYEKNLEQLMKVEKQIREEQTSNEQKKEQIKKMEKKVDCNFNLLNAYKSCDESFKKGTDPYWACIKEAKKDFEQCTFE